MVIKQWQKSEFNFLDSIGLIWPEEIDFDVIWQEKVNLVKEFKNKRNKYPNENSNNLEESRLGKWIANQKKNYKKGKLSIERISFLESISDWKWKFFDETWQQNANLVKEFKDKNNKFPSKISEDLEESRLGRWFSSQKSNYRCKPKNKKTLTKEQISFLESIPDWNWNRL